MPKTSITRIYLSILFLISAVSHWFVIFDWKLLNAGDWIWLPQRTLESMLAYNYWYPHTDFGLVSVFASNIVFYWGAGILALLAQVSWDWYTRITFLLPIIFLTPLFSYLFFKKISNNQHIAFFAASLYSFNSLFLKLQLDNITYAYIWWLLPALFLSTINFETKRSPSYFLSNALLVALGLVYELRITLLVLAYISFYLLTYLFLNAAKGFKHRITYVSAVFSSYFFGIFLHIFWLLPLVFSNLSSDVLSHASTGPFTSYFTLLDSLTLHYYGWLNDLTLAPFISVPPASRFFVIPILALVGVFSYFKKRGSEITGMHTYVFFGLSLILGIFLGKQSFAPFPDVYGWLFYNVPLFNLYRESSKFYILIAASLSFFFGYGLYGLLQWMESFTKKRALGIAAVGVLLAISLLGNLRHFPDQKIGAMSKGVTIQSNYLNFNEELSQDTTPYRILYVPTKPRFVFFSDIHPAINGTDLVHMLAPWTGFDLFDRSAPPSEQFMYVLEQPYSAFLLSLANVRYILLPQNEPELKKTPDEENVLINKPFYDYGDTQREWYKSRLDQISSLSTSTKFGSDLDIYENKVLLPSVHAFDRLFILDSTVNMQNKYSLIVNQLNSLPYFASRDLSGKATNFFGATYIYSPFEGLTDASIDGSSGILATTTETGFDSVIYQDRSAQDVYVASTATSSTFFRQDIGTTSLNNESLAGLAVSRTNLLTIKTAATTTHYLNILGSIYRLEAGTTLRLGKIPPAAPIKLYAAAGNAVSNGSFEEGSWQDVVGDCNHHDDTGILGMNVEAGSATDGSNALYLSATKHIACTSTRLPVAPGFYMLSFDYAGMDTQAVGFSLNLNDTHHTALSTRLPVITGKWQHYAKLVDIPKSASEAELFLYAYSSDNVINNVAKYDNVRVDQLDELQTFSLPQRDRISAMTIAEEPINDWHVTNPAYNLANLIQNPSFEDGLWSATVGDCHNHDDRGAVVMRLSVTGATDGNNALELEAIRHIACTGVAVNVRGGASYILSFDYQSEAGSSSASYQIGFNSTTTDSVTEYLPAIDSSWHHYSKKISVPRAADTFALTLYARESNGRNSNINRYDNFSLIEIADLENEYFVVSDPHRSLNLPISISTVTQSPTKRSLSISAASTGFYLSFSEGYHPQWKLMLDNAKVRGLAGEWSPWALPDAVADAFHYNLDTFLNAWYVDPVALCAIDTAKEAPLAAAAQAKAQAAALAREGNVSAGTSATSIQMRSGTTSASNSVAFSVNTPESTTSSRSIPLSGLSTSSSSSKSSSTTTPVSSSNSSSNSISPYSLQLGDKEPWAAARPAAADVGAAGSDIPAVVNTPAADQSNMREGCIRNEDGSYDIEMIIEFWPQRWFYVGLVISGTTLFLCLLYLLVVGIRSLVQRFNPRARRARAAKNSDAASSYSLQLEDKGSIVEFMPEYQAGPTRAPAQPGLVLAPVWNRGTNGTMPSRRVATAAVSESAARGTEASEQDFAIRGVSDFFLVMARGVYIAWRRVARRPLRMVIVLAVAGAAGWYWGISAGLLWGLFMFFALYRLDSRVVGSLAIVALVACPVLLSLGSEWGDTTAEEVAVYAYFFLVMTVVLQILEYRRQAKREAHLASRQGL